jgi:hypothetical protein
MVCGTLLFAKSQFVETLLSWLRPKTPSFQLQELKYMDKRIRSLLNQQVDLSLKLDQLGSLKVTLLFLKSMVKNISPMEIRTQED